MNVNITISGILRKPSGKSEVTVRLKEEKSVEEVLKEIGYEESELKYMLCFINEKPVSIKEKVKGNDNLFLTLLVGGG